MNVENKAMRRNHQKLVVITGCDTGIGRSLAAIMAARGFTVVISYLDKNPFENESGILAFRMDMRKPEETIAFTEFVKELCGGGMRLDAFVSNAGVALGGPVENIPMSLMRECFEIDFFGAVRIIHELLPDIIKAKGRIVVNGSLAGRIAMPFMSPYTASKFALEGYCDSLRREMMPYGVKVVLLEPSAVATPIWNKAKEQDISFVDEKYMKSLFLFRDNFIEGGNGGLDTEKAAQQISGILDLDAPKARYIIAKQPIRSKILTLLPSWLIDRAVAKMFDLK